MKQVKYGNKPPDGGGEQKILVNVEYASCIIMMGIPTKELDYLPYPGIMFYQTSSHKVLHIYHNTYESQEVLSQIKHNSNIMCVVYSILTASAEAGIYDNLCLIENQSTCNAIIYRKYM